MRKLLFLIMLISYAAAAGAQEAGGMPAFANSAPAGNITAPAPAPAFLKFNLATKLRLDSIQEKVPMVYNAAVQDYIDLYTARKNTMGNMLGKSQYYFPIFEKALHAAGLPDELKYLPVIESSLDPLAVSTTGAAGLWQFTTGTAKGYKLKINEFEDERKDPVLASNTAAAYFKELYNIFGDWLLALAAYNCGDGAVSRAITKAGSSNYWDIRHLLPEQGQNYIPKFIATVYTLKNAGMFGITPMQTARIGPVETMHVNTSVSLKSLAGAMLIDEKILFLLNPSYKQGLIKGTPFLPKQIVLPPVSLQAYPAVYELLNP